MTERLTRGEVSLAYDVRGEGEPLVLLAGCGQPAVAYHLGLVPRLVEGGFQVVTLDNRGVEPSSSPPAPYRVGDMVDDVLAVMDHLGLDTVALAGHSMGGWIAEVLAAGHPDRVGAAAFMGSCNEATSWEIAITTLERDLALADLPLPPLYFAIEHLRYLPNSDLQRDEVVDDWLALTADLDPWPNPGRLGQYEACLAWSTDPRRTRYWSQLRCPCLVLAFEHDIDSPPDRARASLHTIPDARYAEIAGASHLGFITHVEQVAAALLDFFGTR